jgi:hypothetical protein
MFQKLTLSTIVLFTIALGCTYGAESAKETGTMVPSEAMIETPALVVPEWYFDFGEVKEGTEYIHSFVILNSGNRVLEMKKVTPG